MTQKPISHSFPDMRKEVKDNGRYQDGMTGFDAELIGAKLGQTGQSN